MEKNWIVLDRPQTQYSGQLFKELSKRRNKDGTVTLRVKPVCHVAVSTGTAARSER